MSGLSIAKYASVPMPFFCGSCTSRHSVVLSGGGGGEKGVPLGLPGELGVCVQFCKTNACGVRSKYFVFFA